MSKQKARSLKNRRLISKRATTGREAARLQCSTYITPFPVRLSGEQTRDLCFTHMPKEEKQTGDSDVA